MRSAAFDLSRHPTYIVGAAETELGEVQDQNEFSMFALAARDALNDAGLLIRDVDGLFVCFMGDESSVQVGEYLGVIPKYSDSTDFGGACFEQYIHHAMLALAAGRCEVALVGFASRQRSRRERSLTRSMDPLSDWGQWEIPSGLPIPIGYYALAAARHFHEFGTTSEQLAEIAVAARKWAQLNPKAWSRSPLSIADVVGSRMMCDPLHKLDCCLVTDGGGVVVVTDAPHARGVKSIPIRVVGAAESSSSWQMSQWRGPSQSPGLISGRKAFAMAGIEPSDVDVLEPYDAFTISVLMALEDLGFCGRGEGGSYVEGGRLAPDGALPSMTSGGGLSYNHPGAFGVQLLIEAVRQLRGEAGDRQVKNARIAVAHGIGGLLSTASTVVLSRE